MTANAKVVGHLPAYLVDRRGRRAPDAGSTHFVPLTRDRILLSIYN